MQAKAPERAAKEYQIILAHPGLDPDSYLYALAHLGLAQSFSLSGHAVESHAEYKAFLNAWKDADPDLPILKQAKAQTARL